MRTLRFLLVTALAATGLAVIVAGPATAANATVASFQQCSNGNGTALTCAGGWINGSLQTSNSHFAEDGVVPQRVVINLPADNLTHSLTFTYQDRKGSVHAYDALGTWNKTVSGADPCQGLAATLCSAAPSTLTMAADGTSMPPAAGGNSTIVSTHQLPAADRLWTMYGGALVSDVAPTHNSPVSGDDLATVTVRFTNPTPAVARQAVLLFGGHLAVGGPNNAPRAWGVNLGASSVSGGPYAFKLEAIDGGSTGATANSIQANAAAPLPPATFTIAKTASPANPSPGQTVTYTVTVTNTGGIAGSTTFTDDYDNRLSPSTAVSGPAGNNCAPGAGSFSCTTGTIAGGGSQTFTYTAAMPTTFSGGAGTGGCAAGTFPVANTASLTSGGTPATATVCVNAAAAFTVTKTVDDDSATPGQTVSYTITVSNNGSAAGSTTFTDDYDNRLSPSTAVSDPAGNNCTPGAGSFACTTGTIAAGGQQTFTYTAQMPSTFSGGDGGGTCDAGTYQVANTVTVNGSSASRDVCVTASPEFTVTKTVDDDTATPSQTVTYTVTVTNNGSAAGSTTFTDDYDDRLSPSTAVSDPAGDDCTPGAGSFACTTGTILAGASQTFTYTAQMPATFSDGSGTGGCAPGMFPVGNTVTLADDTTAAETVCVGAAANFTLSKSVDDDTPAPGQTVNYTITVSNTGSASGSTTFTDDYDDRLSPTTPVSNPAGNDCAPGAGTFACSTGTVPAGSAVTFTYSAEVPSTFGAVSGGDGCSTGTYPISNTATLASGPSDGATLCVAAAPSYTITKTVDDDSVQPGDVVTYTITVSNTGSAAGSTGFTDDFDDRLTPSSVSSDPAGGSCSVIDGADDVLDCTTSVIAAGAQQTFTYSAAVPTAFTGTSGGGPCGAGTFPVVNTAALDGGASADPVTVCVTAAPSFVVDKSVSDSSPEPGDTVTYTVTVTNNGTADGSTTFTDDFDDRLSPSTATSDPAGDDCAPGAGSFACTTGTIPSLGSQTFTYTATIPSTFSGPGGGGTCNPGSFRIANTVTLSGGTDDTVVICVAAAPDFVVSKTVDDDTAAPGQTVSYTITVSNNGSASGSTTFTDDYDDRLDPTDPVSTPAGGSCTDDGAVLDCTTSDIAAGSSQTFTYSATMPTSFTGTPGGGECNPGEFRIANSVAITGGTSSDGVDVCVAASPDFTVSKSAGDTTVGTGDAVTYTITVTNTGSAPGAATFADDFDDRLSPSTATSDPAGNDCPPGEVLGNGMFVCTTGSIDPGQAQTFTYTAVMPATFTGSSGGGGCPAGRYPIANSVTSGDSSDDVTVCVAAAPGFTVAKEASTEVAAPGQEVTYTITVTNTGTAPGSTAFTDDYDDRLSPSPVEVAPAGGSCLDTTGELECSTSSLEAGQSQTFTYAATLPQTFGGDPGGGDCEPDQFPVSNSVALGSTGDEVTICVDANAQFTLEKTVDDAEADPGQTVTYTVTVTNNGTASGSTSFTDDYDNRLDPSSPVSDPPGGSCTDDGDVLSCTTGDILAGGSQTFSYSATLPATFGTNSGTNGCGTGEFAVRNLATLVDGPGDSATVCVTAAPDLVVTKTVDDDTAIPGQTVTYTITVGNNGTAAGSTTFTDDYDDRLSPTTPVSDPAGTDCEQLTTGNERFECATGTIPAGSTQTFTYSATLPDTFTGASGGGSCPDGSYPIVNSVILGTGSTGGATVCVAAAPNLGLTKSSDLVVTQTGDQLLVYTIAWTNTGPAEATDVVLSDQIPTDTTFVDCTGGCSVAGAPATATWQIGSVAPLTGTGSVTLVVKVSSNQACSITNVAQIQAGSGPVTSSNTVVDNVSPQPDTAGAKSNGSAVGIQVKANGLLSLITGILNIFVSNNGTVTASKASSSQSGLGSATGADSLLSLKLPANGSLVSAGVLSATSASSVTAAPAEARQTTTSSVADLCLVPINGVCTVSATAVRAVASTMANGSFASTGSGGTTIANLKILGLGQLVDLNQTTMIPLNPGIFGKNSYVAINERTASAGLVGGKYVADQKVAMIHLKITGLLGLQAADIVVAQAIAHSEFPKTFVCAAARLQSVSGHAYVARLYTGPLLADLLQGFVAITPFGGDESQQVVALSLPENGSIAGAQVADSRSRGWFTDTSANAVSHAEIAGDGTKPACVLRTGATCIVTATAIRSEARSLATPAGSTSTDTGSQLIGLGVLGIPIVTQPKPNTTIELPGIGFIIVNEQFCDNGTPASHTCSAAEHSGITVRALRVVVTIANNILGLNPGIELVVAEAHADSTYVG